MSSTNPPSCQLGPYRMLSSKPTSIECFSSFSLFQQEITSSKLHLPSTSIIYLRKCLLLIKLPIAKASNERFLYYLCRIYSHWGNRIQQINTNQLGSFISRINVRLMERHFTVYGMMVNSSWTPESHQECLQTKSHNDRLSFIGSLTFPWQMIIFTTAISNIPINRMLHTVRSTIY